MKFWWLCKAVRFNAKWKKCFYFCSMTSFKFLKLTAKKTKVPLFYRKCEFFPKKEGFFVYIDLLILFATIQSFLLMSISNLKTYLSTSQTFFYVMHTLHNTFLHNRLLNRSKRERKCCEYLIWCEKYFI
jgi:hypothetical protein